jgi:hypothetical protein
VGGRSGKHKQVRAASTGPSAWGKERPIGSRLQVRGGVQHGLARVPASNSASHSDQDSRHHIANLLGWTPLLRITRFISSSTARYQSTCSSQDGLPSLTRLRHHQPRLRSTLLHQNQRRYRYVDCCNYYSSMLPRHNVVLMKWNTNASLD